jgi:hypothetical protein
VPDGRANAVDERDPDVRTTEVNFPISPTASPIPAQPHKEVFIQAASKLYGVDPSQVSHEESDEDDTDKGTKDHQATDCRTMCRTS